MSIAAKGISKKFGEIQALNQVDLTFEPGKIYGLLGRNGAGKSTFLNILTQRIFPDQGNVSVDGIPLSAGDTALSKMYLVSEQNYYPESMTVKGAFRWSKAFYPAFDTAYANRLAEAFALPTKGKIRKLSTGYRSIFKLVIALSVNCPYVLLDEPVLGLDANHRDFFYRTLLERYAQNPFTLVISTHLIDEIAAITEDIVILHKGRVLLQGERETLLSRGYAISGPKALVEKYCNGRELLGMDTLGGLASGYILGNPEDGKGVEGLQVSSLDLQKLFILLTEKEG